MLEISKWVDLSEIGLTSIAYQSYFEKLLYKLTEFGTIYLCHIKV